MHTKQGYRTPQHIFMGVAKPCVRPECRHRATDHTFRNNDFGAIVRPCTLPGCKCTNYVLRRRSIGKLKLKKRDRWHVGMKKRSEESVKVLNRSLDKEFGP